MDELLTSEEMGHADRLAVAAGVPSMNLMEAAGKAVADAAAAMTRGDQVVVVCGPGNNGGDGVVAARVLRERGLGVRLLRLANEAALRGDGAEAARRWGGPVETATPAALAGADLIVDALFGAGLARPLDGTARSLVDAINASSVPVLAVDLPSGINGTTGAEMGVSVRATRTVTFFRRKPGHLLLPGRLHCGPTSIADIGIPDAVLDQVRPGTFVNAPARWGRTFPVPRLSGHKYSRGHAVIVSGGMSSTGAARLAARGALRAGAGLVTIASPRDALGVHAAGNEAVMVRAVDGAAELRGLLGARRLNAVALGPALGVGAATRALVLAALDGDRSVVLDADALTTFEDELPTLADAVRGRSGSTVLTPHEGEFKRLFHGRAELVDPVSKLDRTRAASAELGCVLLYKGPDTVVAAPDGRATIAENAPPWLATAGSGDVLTGMIVGLMAQGMPAFEAASACVWLHGEAASAFGPGLISEDIPEALPGVYRALFEKLEPRG
jgi:ADP-dependent NAD(P)H-hydrate dehydratase / NAD(P)H-hydrate epimerase